MAEEKAVKVILSADVGKYVRGMEQAKSATDSFTGKTKESSQATRDWAGEYGQAATQVGVSMLAFGGATAVGVGLAINAYADFDQAMSNVQAATHASAGDMELLTAAARDAGATTAFSATEAAAAIEELAKAGVSTADILNGGLDGALSLAAAGSLGVGEAAEIAATALTQFKLSGEDIPHVADLLAAGAGKAQGEVSDLADALNQGGLVASQMGLSIEETVGGLSAFAAAGMVGSDAGTSFKTMLQRLANPMGKAQQQMDELGISAWDAQGNFVGLAEFSGQLQTAMADLSPEARNAAMSVIFGADAVRAANVLYEQGEEGIRGWITAVDDAGYAAETAAIKQDNLRGDLEKLGGAWDDLLIGMGEAADGPMREVIQALTDLVSWFGELPPEMQAAALGTAALVGGLTLAGGAFLTIMPQIAATRTALETLGITGTTVKSKLSSLFSLRNLNITGAITLAAGAMYGLLQAAEDAEPAVAELQNTLLTTGDAAATLKTALGRDGIAAAFGDGDYLLKYLDDLEGSLQRISSGNFFEWATTSPQMWDFASSLQDVGTQLAELASSDMPAAQDAFRGLVEQYDLGAEAQWQLLEAMDDYKDKLYKLATDQGINLDAMTEQEKQAWLVAQAMGDAGDASSEAAEGVSEYGTAAEATEAAVNDLADAIRAYDDLLAGMMNAEIGYYQALDDATASLEKNGQTLDLTTEAGRENMSALVDLAAQTNEWGASIIDAGGSVEEAEAAIQSGKDQFLALADAMGMAEPEAQALAEELFGMPDSVSTEVTVATDSAKSEIDGVLAKLAEVQGPGNPPITMEVLSDAAISKLEELGIEVTELADGTYSVQLSADPAEAEAQLAALEEFINSSSAETNVGADTQPAEDEVAAWQAATDATVAISTADADATEARGEVLAWKLEADGTWSVSHMDAESAEADSTVITWKRNADGTYSVSHLGAEAEQAYNRLNGFKSDADTSWASVNVSADTSSAESSLSYLTRHRTVTITAIYQQTGGNSTGSTRGGMTYANGGMLATAGRRYVQEFANGGFPTGIYPGGANILKFAEPETRWEAFISGRPGQEERNIGIALEALSRLGYNRAQPYADGGMRDYRQARFAEASRREIIREVSSSTGGGMQLNFNGPLIENATLDSDYRVEQVSQALYQKIDRASRAQGKVSLEGVVK